MQQHLARLSLAVWIGAATSVAHAAPSQLDRAKAVYAEGKALLDKKNYIDAGAKFEEAYRLAPDKHLFNYNIATAAELAGDCQRAQRHYRMFLDLVPEHASRKDVVKSLAALEKTCARDDEGAAALSIEARGDREAERGKAIAERVLTDALRATDQSIARYEAVLLRHGKQQPFAQIVRVKRRDRKKIAKLVDARGFTAPTDGSAEVEAPVTVEQACRQAAQQEDRNAAAYGKAYDAYEDDDVVKLMDKLQRRAEERHGRAFRDTCPR